MRGAVEVHLGRAADDAALESGGKVQERGAAGVDRDVVAGHGVAAVLVHEVRAGLAVRVGDVETGVARVRLGRDVGSRSAAGRARD